MALDTNKRVLELIIDGTEVPIGVDTGNDMLQARVDATNSCYFLYAYFGGVEIPYLTKLNTSKVTNMNYMFNNCSTLSTLDLSNFNTTNVTSMTSMFYGCLNLTSLDLSSFDTSNVVSMSEMFMACHSLTTLDLSSFDFTNVTNYYNMFYGIPTDCLVYVKDQTAYDWITSKFTTLTNIQIKSANV